MAAVKRLANATVHFHVRLPLTDKMYNTEQHAMYELARQALTLLAITYAESGNDMLAVAETSDIDIDFEIDEIPRDL